MEKIVADVAVMQSLNQSEELEALCEGRIYNTLRPEMDEQEDKIPYIVVTYEGMTNECDSKDLQEGSTDTERVNVLCVARDRIQLSNVINVVREACRSYLYSDECYNRFRIDQYELSASPVMGDWTVPCVYQSLNYSITTSLID